MLGDVKATSGFAVEDMDAARDFYEGALGLRVEVLDEQFGVAVLHLANGYDVFMYLSAEMTPPSYTILNFEVEDVDAAVAELGERSIDIERYPEFEHDEKGIVRGPGPQIAWFKDPSGNTLSVLQQP
ncbi:MAG TPA: VOC family protein [Solirubrobacterales bacterium]|jgi:predicted enzyme related to lactoylglutathione lyase|nr:VOC family protein [Solirubrobacterales bacterium]